MPRTNSLVANGVMETVGFLEEKLTSGEIESSPPAMIFVKGSLSVAPVLSPPCTLDIVENCSGCRSEALRMFMTVTSSRDLAKALL
ncbi:hypothetical protein ASE95_15820 [Sphingomonas sp. Leaf231]|nr:hypothetical protein ASE95_15820 [Sphingomonas sp. Leaf231]